MNALRFLNLGRRFFSTFKTLKGSDAVSKYIKDNKTPVLLDFYSEGCSNCSKLAPRLEKEAQNSNLSVLKIDINDQENADLLQKYNVKNVPKLVLLKDGKTAQEKVGNIPDS